MSGPDRRFFCSGCGRTWPCADAESVLACYPEDGAGSGRGGSEPGTPSSLPDPPAEKPQNGAEVRPGGCWLAHYADWSGIAVFDQEIDALRYGHDHGGMTVRFAEWGQIR